MLPTVAVQIAPDPPLPALEQQLIASCNAGLERGRCVSAGAEEAEEPRGVALVSWSGTEHVSIAVGLANGGSPVWLSRELRFASADPEVERWRAVGLTIALLSGDARFGSEVVEPVAAPPAAAPVDALAHPLPAEGRGAPPPFGASVELGALGGTGVVSGPLRWGAELRVTLPVSSVFFATGSASYSLASAASLDVRWLDARLGLGVALGSPFEELGLRVRLELLGENVAVVARRAGESDRASTWVPGAALGADVLLSLGERWLVFARADAFWLDGATAIESAGDRAGAAAGAGALLGAGVGRTF